MEKHLTQQEIDKTLNSAARAKKVEREVKPCNFRTAGELSNSHRNLLATIHSNFAMRAAHSVGSLLGVDVAISFASVEQIRFKDVLESMDGPGFTVALQVGTKSDASMRIAGDVLFPAIDILLSGSPNGTYQQRPLTDIDNEILMLVADRLATELTREWKPLTVGVGNVLSDMEFRGLHGGSERTLLLTFEYRVAQFSGSIEFILPAASATILLRQLTADRTREKKKTLQLPKLTVENRLLASDFNLALQLPNMRVTVRDLLALTVGAVLKTKIPVRSNPVLELEGTGIFEAVPARSGKSRAAQLIAKVDHPELDLL